MMMRAALFVALAAVCLVAHTCEAKLIKKLEKCSDYYLLGGGNQPQKHCVACVNEDNEGEHRTLNPTKGFAAKNNCAFDTVQNRCVRRKKNMKADVFAVSEEECEAKVPLVTVVNDLDVKMPKNAQPVPRAVAQLELRIDPDSLATYRNAPDGTVFVTFLVMPPEEVAAAHKAEKSHRPDPDDVCHTPEPNTQPYPPGTLFMAPGTARTDGKDGGKHTPFPWNPNDKPKVGGHEQHELLPDTQPHLELLKILCGGPERKAGSRAASLFVGGALFKNVKSVVENDYRWTSGGVNGAHKQWMGLNKAGKPVVPADLQLHWNNVIDHLTHGRRAPNGIPRKLASQSRTDPKNTANRQLHKV